MNSGHYSPSVVKKAIQIIFYCVSLVDAVKRGLDRISILYILHLKFYSTCS